MSKSRNPLRIAGIIAAITTFAALMLSAFLGPMLNSGPKNLPLAVAGPDAAIAAMAVELNAAKPGAFDITPYGTAEDVKTAITNREAIGGIVVTQKGVTVQLASGAGSPYVTTLRTVGAAMEKRGQSVTYEDLAPMPDKDPRGGAMTALLMPLMMSGIITGVVLTVLLKAKPHIKGLVALAVALSVGAVTAAVLQFGFQAIDGNYLMTAAAIAAGIAAISVPIVGLTKHLGPRGIALMALTLFFIANPLSGAATGHHWLPSPWGAIGQAFPIGAASSAIRSGSYFDGAGAASSWIVLACWITTGVILLATPARKKVAS